jgi:hypothetical protein
MRAARRATAGTLALACAIAGTALAQDSGAGSRQNAELTFTERKPDTTTGLNLAIDYRNPADPEGKPPAVRRVVTTLARGARYDTSAPDLCTASDAELMALGAGACPEGSVVGEGVITVDSGIPGPARFIVADTIFLNNTDELIFLSTVRGSEARVVTRSEVTQRSVISEAPFLPGTPPDGGAIDTVRIEDFPIARERDGVQRSYIATPPTCPDRGWWTNRAQFTYHDGVTQVVNSRSPCE